MAFFRSSFVVFTLFVAAAVADQSTSSTTTTTPATTTATNAFPIPTDISTDCTTFLTALNTDQDISACITAILSATSPVTAAASPATATTSGAFTALCSASTACSPDVFRTQLTNFGVQCATDLNSGTDPLVGELYDMLYALPPLVQAACVTDPDTGSVCATQPSTVGNNTLSTSDFAPAQAALNADITALGAAALPFLFVAPTAPLAVLCSACFSAVMQVYITFEDSVPYWAGVNQSPLLQQQGALWTAFSSSCGGAVTNVEQQAGAAPPTTSGAIPRAASCSIAALFAVGAALVTYF